MGLKGAIHSVYMYALVVFRRRPGPAPNTQLPLSSLLTRVLIHVVGGTHIGQSEASDQRRPPRLHYSSGAGPLACQYIN